MAPDFTIVFIAAVLVVGLGLLLGFGTGVLGR